MERAQVDAVGNCAIGVGPASPIAMRSSSRGRNMGAPCTPESRTSIAVGSPERVIPRAAHGLDMEANTAGAPKLGDASDDSTMPPPKTPTRKGRRPTPRSKTPSKPRTPSGGLTALRLGQGDKDEEGDEGEAEGERGDEGSSLTPSKDKSRGPNRTLEMTPTKKRAFGRPDSSPSKPPVVIPPAVSRVYGLVNKATGSVGGNGSSGAIYGELTAGCMQKVVNILKEETGFDENSSFIDVGSGLGKPNFHVAQDPGCEISYGLELEEVRWQLSVVNHRRILLDDGARGVFVQKHNTFFAHGDILSAETFDPFTHVYMFDIGFPPVTLCEIAKIFNKSQAPHLISYQFPHKVEEYGFEVDMVLKMPLRLTGSSEGHTMYLYRRKDVAAGLPTARIMEVDPFFAQGVELCRDGGDGSDLAEHVEARFMENTSGGVRTRRSRRLNA